LKLIDYMKQGGMTVEVFIAHLGPDIGMSRGGLLKLIYGQRVPSLAQALKIKDATHGLVKPEDFRKPEEAA
jgi:hypothetical protein